jgi:hypothetical protein
MTRDEWYKEWKRWRAFRGLNYYMKNPSSNEENGKSAFEAYLIMMKAENAFAPKPVIYALEERRINKDGRIRYIPRSGYKMSANVRGLQDISSVNDI